MAFRVNDLLLAAALFCTLLGLHNAAGIFLPGLRWDDWGSRMGSVLPRGPFGPRLAPRPAPAPGWAPWWTGNDRLPSRRPYLPAWPSSGRRHGSDERAWPVGTAVRQCDTRRPILNQTVYFGDCVNEPCKVPPGQTTTIRVAFSPSNDSGELRVYTYKVYDLYRTPSVELNGQTAVIKPSANSPFDSTLTKSDGSNAQFPLKKGETYTWTINMHIPDGMELDSYLAEWALINEYDDKMVCFRVFRQP